MTDDPHSMETELFITRQCQLAFARDFMRDPAEILSEIPSDVHPPFRVVMAAGIIASQAVLFSIKWRDEEFRRTWLHLL